MLMGTYGGGVHRDIPIDLAGRVGGGLDLLEQPLPGAVRRPQPVVLVHGLPRPVALRKIAPVCPDPDPKEDPIDHLSVIPPPSTSTITDRQEGPQPFPLGIRQIALTHAVNNEHPQPKVT
jgi:hypothetical protein